jgi:hypothetical protein
MARGAPGRAYNTGDMQALSLIWGILAMLGMLVAFFPCLGALNWLNIPFSIAGLIVGIIAMSKAPPAQNGSAKAGVILCAIATILGMIRLLLGGGVL